MLPDRHGQLARAAELVAVANANVVEVLYTRRSGGLRISRVELELHIETCGPEHREPVISKLRDAGYELRIERYGAGWRNTWVENTLPRSTASSVRLRNDHNTQTPRHRGSQFSRIRCTSPVRSDRRTR